LVSPVVVRNDWVIAGRWTAWLRRATPTVSDLMNGSRNMI
jgi:hypothetical protein